MSTEPNSELFEPVGHESVSEAVISQIESLIASGILKQGGKLPPERDLATMMGVSRPKLREALHSLEQRALIQTRHGEGTFVAPLTGQAMLPSLLALYGRHEPAFFDYLEYRRAQESFAARLAAERATSADKERLSGILAEIDRAWQAKDRDAEHEADFAFHTAIVDASQNATLIHMMASIYDLTRQGVFYNRDYLRSIDNTGKTLRDQHFAIGEAILAGDGDTAANAAREHIDFVKMSFLEGSERQKRERLAKKRRMFAEM